MNRRRLGPHGPEIAPIVLGAWQIGGWFWGEADDDEAIRAIHAALDAGIDAIDTAPVYGFGHSEAIVGRALRGRRDVVVMTKCGLSWDGEGQHFFDTRTPDGRTWTIRRHAAKDAILRECDASLRRLGVDAIDLYQLHWPEPGREPEEVMDAMRRLLEAGKIKAIGVSNCPADWMARAAAVAPLTCHQPKWSYLSRREESASIAWSREHGVGAIVYSPLEMGLLTGKIGPDHAFGPGDERRGQPWFKPENVARVQAAVRGLDAMAADKGCSLAQLVLAATIREPGITGAIAGARNARQAADNAAAMSVDVSEEERGAIRAALDVPRG